MFCKTKSNQKKSAGKDSKFDTFKGKKRALILTFFYPLFLSNKIIVDVKCDIQKKLAPFWLPCLLPFVSSLLLEWKNGSDCLDLLLFFIQTNKTDVSVNQFTNQLIFLSYLRAITKKLQPHPFWCPYMRKSNNSSIIQWRAK